MTAAMPEPTLTPCVLDIEASGFGRRSYPIEIGYVLSDGRSRCMLVRPDSEWTHWDDAAERMHGITRPTLLAHGRPPAEVAAALNAELAGQTVYCDGWAHDYTWLAALFDAAGLVPAFKLESVRALLHDDGLARLDDARRSALLALGLTRHRASNDARALQRALVEVQPQAGAAAGTAAYVSSRRASTTATAPAPAATATPRAEAGAAAAAPAGVAGGVNPR